MDRQSAVVRTRAVALIAAIAGLGASAYLLVEYTTGQPGICLTGSGCDLVRASAFAYPLGIPLPLIGLVFYTAAGWVVLRTVDSKELFGVAAVRVLVVLATLGALISIVLTGMEAFVIGAFCTWCLVQAAASLVLLAATASVASAHPAAVVGGGSQHSRRKNALRIGEERASLRRSGLLATGVAAMIVGALLVIGAIGTGAAPGEVDGITLAPPAGPRLGAGAVQVVEFADFQCPGCAALAPMLVELANGDEMTLIYRYLPLDTIHANADRSARAAAAADHQNRFWPMAERLFSTQAAWEHLAPDEVDAYFADAAAAIGLDVGQWRADYLSTAVSAAVDSDRQAAAALGLQATPTIFVGGRRYEGSLSLDGIRKALAEAAATPI
jgi:protein-disulfide isomerase